MFDPRMQKLARSLIRYSCQMKKGERILIESIDVPDEMVALLIREAREVDAIPLVTVKRNRIIYNNCLIRSCIGYWKNIIILTSFHIDINTKLYQTLWDTISILINVKKQFEVRYSSIYA